MMKRYLNYLRSREENILQMIQQLVEFESPTMDKSRNDRLANIVQDIFVKFTGGTAEIIENKNLGNHVLGQVGKGDDQILIVGHFDTVHPAGTLKENPFKIDNGLAFGPGIYDMKTGIVQAIYALSTLKEMNVLDHKKVVCVFNADEELGSKDSMDLIIQEAKKSKMAFVLEPSFGKEGAIKTVRKGVGSYKITVNGQSAHAGNNPEDGANAIEEMSYQVLKLQKLNNYEKGISVNCGIFNGGTAKNTVPDFAELVVDMRAPSIKDSERLHDYIVNLEPKNPHVTLEVEGHFTRPPMEKSPESGELYQMARDLMFKNCHLPLPEAHVGGASDGNNIAAYVPTLDGLGAVGSGAHSLDEYIFIEHLVPRTALLAALIEQC